MTRGAGWLVWVLLLGSGLLPAAELCVDDDNQTGLADGTPLRPYTSIQDALDAAVSGDVILVAAGSYGPVVVEDKALTLTGAYPGGTAVDYAQGTAGDFGTSDPTVSVTALTGTLVAPVVELVNASGSTVQGFEIRGGLHGVEIDDDISWPPQQGITVRNNLIENNGPVNAADDHRGGGIYVSGEGVTIVDNTIRNNAAGRGAGIGGGGDGVLISGNLIEGNDALSDHGGGIYMGGAVTITANAVLGNQVGEALGYGWGGGILVLGEAYLEGNTVSGNSAASHGGGFFADEGAHAVLVNELVVGNKVSEDYGGAGVYVDEAWDGTPSTAELRNCTVAMNSGPGDWGGHGLYITGAAVTVTDSVFWGNGDDFYVENGSLELSYSLSEEELGGTGNLHQDPLFADSASGDFHLRSRAGRWDPQSASWVCDVISSPAIDAGDPSSPWYREPLPRGGRINLGAFGNTRQASRSGDVCVLFADDFEDGHVAGWMQ